MWQSFAENAKTNADNRFAITKSNLTLEGSYMANDLASMNNDELLELMRELGEPNFRAKRTLNDIPLSKPCALA